MDLIQFLEDAKLIIGLILTAFGSAGAVVVWFHRRMHAVAVDATEQSRHSTEATVARMQELEADVVSLRTAVADVDDRVIAVEKTLETVARTDQVQALSLDLNKSTSAIKTQVHMVSQQLNMLYEAALRASDKK